MLGGVVFNLHGIRFQAERSCSAWHNVCFDKDFEAFITEDTQAAGWMTMSFASDLIYGFHFLDPPDTSDSLSAFSTPRNTAFLPST